MNTGSDEREQTDPATSIATGTSLMETMDPGSNPR